MAKNFKLNKNESLLLFQRIIDLIKKTKKGFFILRKLHDGAHGYCDWDDGIIIDYRRDFRPTIIHECIHFLEPDWSEKQVMYSESRVINNITDTEVIMLLMVLVKKL